MNGKKSIFYEEEVITWFVMTLSSADRNKVRFLAEDFLWVEAL